jgi:hypothetical protein
MSKTTLPRAPWPWADPLWWARQQIRAATYLAHITETAVRASLAAYGDAARSSVHALTHGSDPWGAWGIATATPAAPEWEAPVAAAPVREAPVAAAPVREAPVAAAPVQPLNGRLTAAEPKPELTPAPPAAELVVVPAAPELTAVTPDLTAVTPDLTAVTPEPQPAAAPAGPDEAPVPGWDELTLGSIRARLRRLSEDDLVALHDWEEGHHARADVLSMLVNRLAKVRSAE